MNFYAPHKNVTFEGYYSKFILPSQASLVLIVCSVPNAPTRRHMVSLTYVSTTNDHSLYQHEIYAEEMSFKTSLGKENGFELSVPHLGIIQVHPDSKTTYSFHNDSFTFHATTTSHVPWSSHTSTPESWLINLPLPLHWHVHSLASTASFNLKLPDYANLAPSDRQGAAIVHQEKNWANSFPSAHIWLQAYDPETSRGICCAGGRILGMDAYLLGYRNKQEDLEVDFRPPFALKVLGISPFMSVKPDWDTRCFDLTVQSFRLKIVVRAWVEKKDWESFYSLSAPFADGHRPNFLSQSLRAKVEVQLYKRNWFDFAWKLLIRDKFEGAALEFGADYYPLRGEGKKDD